MARKNTGLKLTAQREVEYFVGDKASPVDQPR